MHPNLLPEKTLRYVTSSSTLLTLLTLKKVLSSQEEVLSNVFWRFLQLRGYINEKHELTSWGESLAQALSVLDPADNLEEPAFLAIEMIRLGVLNTREWFSHVSGGPMRGTGKGY